MIWCNGLETEDLIQIHKWGCNGELKPALLSEQITIIYWKMKFFHNGLLKLLYRFKAYLHRYSDIDLWEETHRTEKKKPIFDSLPQVKLLNELPFSIYKNKINKSSLRSKRLYTALLMCICVCVCAHIWNNDKSINVFSYE